MNIITNNPYRILGVFANSRRQEIIANKSKASAFLKIGKSVDFPLDLNGLMMPLSRTVDMFEEAEAHIAIAKEQIKYAQFWFLKITSQDEVAFNHLIAGNITKAKEIWSIQESLSSLQNKMICSIIEKEYGLALNLAENLYSKFGNDYISTLDENSTIKMSSIELLHQFIDNFSEEVDMTSLLDCKLSTETKNYINSKTITPLINKISSEVEKAKKVDHKKAKARLEAGKKLISSTKESLTQLRGVISVSAPQFGMISDKLGLEILQCGIDYLNYSNKDDDDAPRITLNILQEAYRIVVGSLAKQRCLENIKTVKGIIENMPPKGTSADIRKIENEVTICKCSGSLNDSYIDRITNDYDYVIGRKWLAELESVEHLLYNTKQSLSNIKAKTSDDNDFYVNISTHVASTALSRIVGVVNKFQNDPNLFLFPTGYSQDNSLASEIKNMLTKCWDLIKRIDDMDVSVQFANHYKTNRDILKKMCKSAGVNTFDFLSLEESDIKLLWWIGSIIFCLLGLVIGDNVGGALGAIVGGFLCFSLFWKIKLEVIDK
jgi:hypothetical protein